MKYQPNVLYKGMTRPAMVAGVPYLYLLFALSFYSLIVLVISSSNILMVVFAALLYIIGFELGRNDTKLFKIWYIKLFKLQHINLHVLGYWKSKTYGAY